MTHFNFKLITLVMFLCLFSVKEVKATTSTCSTSTKHKSICTQKTAESTPVNSCVANENMKQHFIDNPYSFAGDCSEFDSRKIQTYACNAGLRFVSAHTKCIRRDQENLISSTCGNSLDCSCSSTPPDEMDVNYFNFEKANYTGSQSPAFIPYSLSTSTSDEFAMASKSSGSEILKDGSALQFNLGSDFYGAEYFVDICVKNKNAEIKNHALDLSGSILFGNSVFNKVNYITSSKLSAEVDTTCVTTGNTSSVVKTMNSGPFLSGQRSFNGVSIPSAKLCVIRHYFNESAAGELRAHSFKKVTIQTSTNITPKDQSLLEFKTPLSFCNISYNSKNKKYTCEQWTSKSNEDFMVALKVKTFFGANTYTGQCRFDCKPF